MSEQICKYCGAENGQQHTKSCPTLAQFPEGAIASWERGKKTAMEKQIPMYLVNRHSPYFRLGYKRFDVK